jgi:hypothetical protein
MNIELLQGQFKVIENSSFDSTDPRLDDIATLAQAGEYGEAARLSEEILTAGIYDVRLICYFLYGYFLEQGLVNLIEVVDSLNNIVIKNWDALGPINKREKVFEKSLEWLLKQLLKKIQYEESKNTDLWQEWKMDINADQINQIFQLGGVLRLSLNHQFEDKAGALVDLWSKIDQWLRVFQQLECQPIEVQEETLDTLSIDEPIPAKLFNAPVMTLTNTGLALESSYHMDVLLKKLAAFERLIEEEKFPRAALMAEDINQTVSNFDPKLYFPKVFETFVRLQALNFEQLATYTYQRDEQHWQIMQDWLKVDIDSFVKS